MENPVEARLPRFRLVLELSFAEADPWDPSLYQLLLERFREVIQGNNLVPCKDVIIREAVTIGDNDNYEDWRLKRKEFDSANWPEEGRGQIKSGTS